MASNQNPAVPPWQIGGKRFSPYASSEHWAQAAGLNWHIVEAPVSFTPARRHPEPVTFDGMSVLYRSDTSSPLAIVPSTFNVTQPSETLYFFRKLAEFYEYEVVDMGGLQNGKLLWCVLRTGAESRQCGRDAIRPHLLLSAHCDRQVAAFLHPICIFTEAYATFPGSARALRPVALPWSDEFLRPESLMDIAALEAELRSMISGLELLEMHFVSIQLAREYFSSLLSLQLHSEPARPTRSKDRQLRAITTLYEAYANEPSLRSAWGLLRTAVIYIDHCRRFESGAAQQNYAWFGGGKARKQFAIELAYSLTA